MCGIAGIVYLTEERPGSPAEHGKILSLLKHRGPDFQTYKQFRSATLYHSRLEIVDTTALSNQPFMSTDQQQALVFNGEIFNYKTLQKTQSHLKSQGDTEVLFNLLLAEGKNCLDKLNGFFSFAFYNASDNSLLLARDRLGVKPLYYFKDEARFIFASELKPLLELAGRQPLNSNQISAYFRLNYAAGEESIFQNVYRLLPGQCLSLKGGALTRENWYQAPVNQSGQGLSWLLEDAVKLRLQADVPVGTFLSGGLDSSIISALAKKHKPDLNTFSIGFKDEQYFDESAYAELVASHIQSNHHAFRLTEDDFLKHIDPFLAAIDEPFADSSAFNVYMLSMLTQKHVKVALSGDGADELFKGYHKHKALLFSDSFARKTLARMAGVFLPQQGSRQGKIGNAIRQLKKFNALGRLSDIDKQKLLAGISSQSECERLLKIYSPGYFNKLFAVQPAFRHFNISDTFDLQTVLADDMLVKADRFSMQHGIEIRNPFLDYRILEFALNLSPDEKINSRGQKIILRERFGHLLPAQILKRPKKGFELPLQKWLSGSLRSKLENDWLHPEKIAEEKLLNYPEIEQIKNRLFSSNPGDSAARLWAVIVFESWLQNFKNYIQA